MWEPRRLTTLWAFTACYRYSLNLQVNIHSHLYEDSFVYESSRCIVWIPKEICKSTECAKSEAMTDKILIESMPGTELSRVHEFGQKNVIHIQVFLWCTASYKMQFFCDSTSMRFSGPQHLQVPCGSMPTVVLFTNPRSSHDDQVPTNSYA
jgi:hypothetical protein